MKNILKTIIYKSILLISKIFAVFRSKNTKRALILAPSWEGSIGDEAVIDSISFQLKKQGFTTTLIHFAEKREWDYLKSIDNWYSISKYFKGGIWSEHLRFISLFSKSSHFYTLGTDMMDGCYADWLTNGIIKITDHAAHAGLKTTIVGFSINKWQRKDVIKNLGAINSKVRYCLRDDVSRQRFSELLPHITSELTADMAFVLEPTIIGEQIKAAKEWVINKKDSAKTVVGVNINPQLFNDEQKTNEFIGVFTNAIKDIYAKYPQLAFVLIPHDFRETNSDIILLEKLKSNMDAFCKEDVFLISKQFLASDMKGLVSNIDVVVTARMHLSIACLGQGTPIGCIVYQGKFEGLFNHFGLSEDYMMEPTDAMDLKTLTTFIDMIISERATIKKQVVKALPEVKRKSLLNI